MTNRAAQFVQLLRSTKKERRLVEGIPIPDGVRREFEETAAELGISFP